MTTYLLARRLRDNLGQNTQTMFLSCYPQAVDYTRPHLSTIMANCSVDGCSSKVVGRGLCDTHYRRFMRHGTTAAPKRAPPGAGYIFRGYRIHEINGIRKFDHVRNAETALGRELPPAAIVHHVNENKLDNANTNLVICPDQAYHKLLHIRTDALNACGNANWRRCKYCKQYDDPVNLLLWKNGRRVPHAAHAACSKQASTSFRHGAKKRRSESTGALL